MKQRFTLVLVFFFLIAFFSSPIFGAANLYKIAVLPFDDGSIQGDWNWDVGKGVSDEMVTALLNTKRFRLIEREQVDKVLAEQDFGASNRVDARTAAKIGKILGVQFLVIGRITEFTTSTKGVDLQQNSRLNLGLGLKSTKSSVAIDARLVDTASAEIITSVTGKGSKSSGSLSVQKDWNSIAFGSDEFRKTDLGIALRDAVNSTAKQLADQAYNGSNAPKGGKLSGSVAFAKGDKIVLNIGSGEGVTNGMVFVVNHLIEEIKDPDTGEVIDQQIEPVAEIKATEVKEKSTTCTLVKKLSKDYDIAVSDKVEQK